MPPADQRVPRQEHGVRPARPPPYELHADATAAGGTLTIAFRNTGAATAVFQARSAAAGEPPRGYTVAPGRTLIDTWAAGSGYDVSVHGPNGFFRSFRGTSTAVTVSAGYDAHPEMLELTFTNPGRNSVDVTVTDRYTSTETTLQVGGRKSARRQWNLSRTRGWYDLTIAVGEAGRQQYAGHVESGADSITDPLMGGLV